MNANGLALYYGGPVWLVGSAVTSKTPRDYDIRVVIQERDRARLFGPIEKERTVADQWCRADWLLAAEGLRVSRRLSERFGCNIDFQLQSEERAAGYDLVAHPRVRLDSAPDDLFAWPGEP